MQAPFCFFGRVATIPCMDDAASPALLDCLLCHQDGSFSPIAAEEAIKTREREPGTYVWITLRTPSSAELERWAEAFTLHPLAIEDALQAHQRPKMERYGEMLFVVLKTVHHEDDKAAVLVNEVMLFVGQAFFITVVYNENDLMAEARATLQERAAWGSGAAFHAVADVAVDRFADVLEGLQKDILDVEEQVFATPRSSHAERIFHLKREVLNVRRALAPLATSFERLYRDEAKWHELPWIDARLIPYFRDVHDHVLHYNEALESQESLLTSALTVTATLVGMRQNEDMRRISAWGAIIAVPTMIAGVYGMNFRYMPEISWPLGYPVALLVMAGISGGLYVSFRRLGWL